MKIIDLLNKVANDEKLPQKIKYQSYIFEIISNNQYETEGVPLVDFINHNLSNLNDEVEIIEDEIGLQQMSWTEIGETLGKIFMEISEGMNNAAKQLMNNAVKQLDKK